MNQKYSLNVNGTVHTVEADEDMPLLYALRNDLGRQTRLLANAGNLLLRSGDRYKGRAIAKL